MYISITIRIMASTRGDTYEIRKFDIKNLALWKEMMDDIVVQRCHIETIRYEDK